MEEAVLGEISNEKVGIWLGMSFEERGRRESGLAQVLWGGRWWWKRINSTPSFPASPLSCRPTGPHPTNSTTDSIPCTSTRSNILYPSYIWAHRGIVCARPGSNGESSRSLYLWTKCYPPSRIPCMYVYRNFLLDFFLLLKSRRKSSCCGFFHFFYIRMEMETSFVFKKGKCIHKCIFQKIFQNSVVFTDVIFGFYCNSFKVIIFWLIGIFIKWSIILCFVHLYHWLYNGII